jgi:predicted membrane-bound mannosyltransferase
MPPHATAPKIAATALAVFLVTATILFTWLGRNWAVFGDLLHAIPSFAARAGGEGHAKPFSYYFQLLDPLFVLSFAAAAGVFGAVCDAVGGTRKASLLLVVYGLVIFLIYSAIPYKTPWLALNLWLPLALICGFGVQAFWEQIKSPAARWGMGIAVTMLLAKLATQTKVLAFDRPADEKNPLAYAHTGEDLLRLPGRLAELAQSEKLSNPRIAVVAADAWPLPWYLRKFSQVGFWQPEQDTGAADFFITSTDVPDKLAERLKKFQPEYFGWRPNLLLILWVPAPAEAKP